MAAVRVRFWVLALVMVIFAMSWTRVVAVDAPVGCEAVFAATSRGGGTATVGNGGSCNFFGSGDNEGGSEVSVVRVIDGDTVSISGGERIRYLGIDTPEIGDDAEFFGPEASGFNRSLIVGHDIRVEKDVSDRDRFDRLLRFVYADGILVNAELVREGYARATAFEPDTKYAPCFAALEQEAREAGRGMWAR